MTESNITDGAYQQDVQNVYSDNIVATSILMTVFMVKPSFRFLISLAQMNYIEDHICLTTSYPKTAIVITTEVSESASTAFE